MNKEMSANMNLSHYRIVSKIGAGEWARLFDKELSLRSRLGGGVEET